MDELLSYAPLDEMELENEPADEVVHGYVRDLCGTGRLFDYWLHKKQSKED